MNTPAVCWRSTPTLKLSNTNSAAIILTVCQALSSDSFMILRTSLRRPERRERGGSASRSKRRRPEVYSNDIADAMEADLQPLATSGLVTRISKYDTNPANRPQSPHCPASGATHPRERAECPLLAGTKTDIPKYLGDVRCWVNSGKHLLSLSFSGFDPARTSSAAFQGSPLSRPKNTIAFAPDFGVRGR